MGTTCTYFTDMHVCKTKLKNKTIEMTMWKELGKYINFIYIYNIYT